MRDAGLPLDEAGLRELHRRSLPLPAVMPPRLHRKTWAARFGAHSKTGSPDRQPPESLTLTDDDLLRLRPNRGLRLRFADGGELDCTELARRFGDLDPEGIRIYESLVDPAGIKDTGRNPRPRLFLPPWWADYLDTHGLPTVGAWPSASVIGSDSGLFAALRVKKAGLEQEAILLDPRLGAALEELV